MASRSNGGEMINSRVLLLISYLLLLETSCSAKKNHLCRPSSCGEIDNISYPFRLKGDPKDCGLSKHELSCEDNRTVLYIFAGRYYVKSIHYSYYGDKYSFLGNITMVDDGLQKGNYSSLPRYSLASSNFSHLFNGYSLNPVSLVTSETWLTSVVLMKCSQPIDSASYVDIEPCMEGANSADMPPNFSQMKVHSYAVHGYDPQSGDIKDSCTITMMAFAKSDYIWSSEDDRYNRVSLPCMGLHDMMAEGFTLTYSSGHSSLRTYSCYLYYSAYPLQKPDFHYFSNPAKAMLGFTLLTFVCPLIFFASFVASKFILGAPCVMIFLIYKWKRRHRAMDGNIEKFLQAHNNFLPIRYSYSDIKKITKNFKHKLGEGGYGYVYKGTLRSGHEVAVKILKNSKSKGQDFINEVATIGRIHHVNVVQLVGFSFDDSKQALVYEFMSNGSLDKHIFSKEGDDSLDSKKIYEISLGVAKGIEYLHRGCDMQILHFDIKPHNILLDQNFIPKVSDFGLARLYPSDKGIVSLTAARGTLGYMAPELFYKDIGGISYKADVYSFGMLLMEMAGRRKNVKANVERSSQVYFPLWVYDQLSKENEVEMEEVEGERETRRKMVIVALWCIQLIPDDRPSMSRVLNMLEGDIDKLRLPPKPLLYPSEKPIDVVDTEIELESFSKTSNEPTIFEGY